LTQDKNARKEYTTGENCQEGLQQGNYLDSQIKDMTKNIGEDWKETGDNGKENDKKEKKSWRQ